MKRNKGQNRVEELEKYLGSSWNRVIYHRLTRGDRAGLFEPLKFLKQLRGLYSYVTVNKHKPSVLVERLNQIKLTNAKKSFLLYYLDILFFEDSIRDAIERQIRPDSRTEATLGMHYQVEILAEWAKLRTPVDNLDGYRPSGDMGYGYRDSLLTEVRKEYVHRRPGGKDELARAVMDMAVKQRLRLAIEDRYNFDRVRQHLDTLPDNETKIIYLIEIKAEYLQVGATSDPKSERFDQKCELEIKKLKRLIKITKPGKLVASAQNDKALPLVNDGSSAKATRGRRYIDLTDRDWETICEMYNDHLDKEQERLTQRQIYDKLAEIKRRMSYRTFEGRCSERGGWPPLARI